MTDQFAISSFTAITCERLDRVAVMTLNRPEKKNAMNPTLHREAHAFLRTLQYDSEVSVLIVRGAGGDFSSGQDVKESFHRVRHDDAERRQLRELSHDWRHRLLHTFPKVTIAAIDGWCVGGALSVVASCDIAIASHDAKFVIPEVNLGSIPAGTVSRAAQAMLNERQAMFFSLTGSVFSGKTAARLGMITYSVDQGTVDAHAHLLAQRLASRDLSHMQIVKRAFRGIELRSLTYSESAAWTEATYDGFCHRVGSHAVPRHRGLEDILRE